MRYIQALLGNYGSCCIDQNNCSKPLLQHQVLLKVHCSAFQGFEGHSVCITNNGACFKTKVLQGKHTWFLSGFKKGQLIPITQHLKYLMFILWKTLSLNIYSWITWWQEWCQHQETTAENGNWFYKFFLWMLSHHPCAVR